MVPEVELYSTYTNNRHIIVSLLTYTMILTYIVLTSLLHKYTVYFYFYMLVSTCNVFIFTSGRF